MLKIASRREGIAFPGKPFEDGIKQACETCSALPSNPRSLVVVHASRLPPKLIATEGDGLLVVKRKGLYSQIEKQTEEDHEESA